MINLHFRLPRLDYRHPGYDQDEDAQREAGPDVGSFLKRLPLNHQACIWNESGDGEKQVDLRNIQETEVDHVK